MSERDSDDSADGGTGASLTRRETLRAWAVAASIGVAGAALPGSVAAAPYKDTDVTINEIWTEVLSRLPDNWGRWGENDEVGTLNYLDGRQAFRGMEAAMQEGAEAVEWYTLQPPYTGDVIPTEDDDETPGDERTKTGDPVFPTRQPARRDQVVDDRHYKQGIVEELQGGMKFSDDAFITRLFLQGSTQADAIAHIWYDTRKRPGQEGLAAEREGLLYNGYPSSTLSTPHEYDVPVDGLRPADDPENDPEDAPEGFDPFMTDLAMVNVNRTYEASRVGVSEQAEYGEVGRCVFLDVGRNGPPDLERSEDDETRLEQGVGVGLEDIKATADAQGVTIEERDILLFRFGGTEKARDIDAVWTTEEPGLSFSQDLIEWIHEMEIPIVGADNLAVELLVDEIDPQEDLNEDLREDVENYLQVTLDEPFDVTNPIHPALVTNLGLPIHEIFLFDELGAVCEEDGIYEMLYVGAPLNIVGGDGAPINPTVVKATTPDSADESNDGDEDGEVIATPRPTGSSGDGETGGPTESPGSPRTPGSTGTRGPSEPTETPEPTGTTESDG